MYSRSFLFYRKQYGRIVFLLRIYILLSKKTASEVQKGASEDAKGASGVEKSTYTSRKRYLRSTKSCLC